MIREASIYALKKLPDAERSIFGLRVLTMRRWPRGVSRSDIDVWMPSAGPSIELLAALHLGNVAWEDFLTCYREEQQNQDACCAVTYANGQRKHESYPCGSIDRLQHLEQQYGIITLLCWERDSLCHRYTLKALVEQSSQGHLSC